MQPDEPPATDPMRERAPPSARSLGTPLAMVVHRVLRETATRVLQRVHDANDVTSREVVAVVDILVQIVRRAQDQVGATRTALDSLAGDDKRGITDLIARQSEISATRFGAIRTALEQQTILTRQAMLACSEIASVGAGISKVAYQAKMLSLNAHIEAAHFGPQGGGFEVIALEMRRLTNEIEGANRQVESMAQSLLKSLPQINEQATELCRQADFFTQELTDSSQAVGTATAALRKSVNGLLAGADDSGKEVLAALHSALVHLQFQEPTAQSLLRIDGDLNGLGRHLDSVISQAGADSARVAEDSVVIAPSTPPANNADVEGSAEPGDVLFF